MEDQVPQNTQEFIDYMHQEAQKINSLQFKYQEQNQSLQNASNVLITGTTGFIGCFTLYELLKKQPQIQKIYCVVRAKSQEHALQRIIDNLKFYWLHKNLSEQQLQKIIPIIGDISKENLGIDQQQYNEIRQNVTFVYHIAAAVNFVDTYEVLKPSTVLGTQNILHFCSSNSQFNSKLLYFVSTNGILPPKYPKTFMEDKNIDEYIPRLVNDGYGQSKWVAEKMMWICENKGLKVSAFRFGNVGHTLDTGAKNPIDFQSQLLETCKLVNSMPDCQDWKLEATPVDFIAKSMVALAQNFNNFGKVYHIIENDSIHSLEVFKLLQENKHIENIESYEIWAKKVAEGCETYKNCQNKRHLEAIVNINDSLADLQKYLTDTNDYNRDQIKQDLNKCGIEYNTVDAYYYELILSKDTSFVLK